MLGVVHNGVAYPLLWTMLDKKGNSNSDERMDLLDRFEQIFPDAKIDYISGERECLVMLRSVSKSILSYFYYQNCFLYLYN